MNQTVPILIGFYQTVTILIGWIKRSWFWLEESNSPDFDWTNQTVLILIGGIKYSRFSLDESIPILIKWIKYYWYYFDILKLLEQPTKQGVKQVVVWRQRIWRICHMWVNFSCHRLLRLICHMMTCNKVIGLTALTREGAFAFPDVDRSIFFLSLRVQKLWLTSLQIWGPFRCGSFSVREKKPKTPFFLNLRKLCSAGEYASSMQNLIHIRRRGEGHAVQKLTQWCLFTE